MRAYVIKGYGEIGDVLDLVDLPDPAPGPEEVVIDLKAAALNPIDLMVIKGGLKRIERYAMPHRIGFDGAGVVSAVGRDVRSFSVGDEVYVRAPRWATGTFAERIAVAARYIARKPRTVGFAEAASLPLVGLTTVQGLVDRAKAKAGQSILVHAGSGGVGTFAIQFAKNLGLRVTTTVSSRNADFALSLGADEVIAYDREDYRSRERAFDIVFDTIGKQTTLDSFSVCRRGGVVVSIAGPPDRDLPNQVGAGPVLRLMMRFLSRKVHAAARASSTTYFRFLTESDGAELGRVAELVDARRIKPIIDRTVPFEELASALSYLAEGHARGKVVLEGASLK